MLALEAIGKSGGNVQRQMIMKWQTAINSRAQGYGCPYCSGNRASKSNSLANNHSEIAKQWHPTKNGGLTPWDVTPGSGKKVWWKCPVADDHEWEAPPVSRTHMASGCPCCENLKTVFSNCLATTHPEIAKQWHPTKNGELSPETVVASSPRKVWWKCSVAVDHEWQASIASRTRLGAGCSCCVGLTVVKSNCLSTTHPDLAKEWHPTKNDDLTPEEVIAGTERIVWWKCPKGPDHVWQARVDQRSRMATGCPRCNIGWTLDSVRAFVESLKDHLHAFTPGELYLLFQQNGMLRMYGKAKSFVNALATGRFPSEEIEKFVNGDPSLVDRFVQDPTRTLETLDATDEKPSTDEDFADRADTPVDEVDNQGKEGLPLVETKDVLASLGLNVVTSADEEAVEFMIASGISKLWKHAYRDEATAVAQADAFQEPGYAERVKNRFRDEYRQARDLPIPPGYAFQLNGKPTLPNLMQRHFAVRVREQKRVGNWSGTGSGKTLAAILATRVVGSKLTVVCCPNSVVEGWRQAILDIFPDSVVATKTFEPERGASFQLAGAEKASWKLAPHGLHRYLVLNYEAFQQSDSAERVRALVEREPIDFVIVDEIHYAKQRAVEDISKRRQLVTALTTLAAERNPDLHVLGMSATPVINNLHEGKSMVELVSGLAHDELDIRPTVPNCMKLHQRLVTLGIRWMPDYQKMLGYECREERVPVDCTEFLDEIRALGDTSTPLKLEQILTRARLPVIRAHVKPKTLIYTHYIEGIDRLLRDALLEDGWKVGFYTGDDKRGKVAFIKGDLDVLIATAAIGTGVDGLQHVCKRLIVNVLPWTRAEYDQLLGRIYRQGQVSKEEVAVIIPLTYALVIDQRWSWCESKMHRLAFKKSIADAAVDGVVPEGHLRSPAQALQDVMAWLERLDGGEVEVITRPKIVVPLPDTDQAGMKRRRRYGDFSKMNLAWNQSASAATHKRLQKSPEEWAQYHTLYREARQDWAVVPYEEMIRWCQKRTGYVIGDFGCGEAKLAEAVSDRHTVHSFDHVAINNNVVACDMAHVPVDDESLDVAIFSLALMGANFADYLREAYRTLKLDGDLHIWESTSRFNDRNHFAKGLEGLGFTLVSMEDEWKFTHIRALKSERKPTEQVQMHF
jgi:superfamily II DNA or RNA helicase